MFVLNPFAFGGAPSQSLELNDAGDYLSLSDADWGSYDREKFAIAVGLYPTSTGAGERAVITKGVISAGAGDPSAEFYVAWTPADRVLAIQFEDALGNVASFFCSGISASTWSSFLIWYDSANATSSERIRVWRNGTELSPGSYSAPVGATTNNGLSVRIGDPDGSGTSVLGNVWSFAFFDGVLPPASDIFDGTGANFRSFGGIAGLKSYLALDGGSPTYDSGLLVNWNNNGVTASSARP